ncbi:MAG: S-methyl-5-thioribose-1-phosphate isomerase [Thermoplasmata archaeon]|nr:S-methyl-5-thioribose-1-phosphate isomerase [Thermoplasmata archaeon]
MEQRVPLAVSWHDGATILLDQRLLPHETRYVTITTVAGMATAIRDMVVRGAPAIGVAAAYGMAIAHSNGDDILAARSALEASRPTAKDLFTAVDRVAAAWKVGGNVLDEAHAFAADTEAACRRIGEFGAELIPEGARVLTHCNAGALATVYWGTALSPIRVAHLMGKMPFVFVDETRPRNQGSRLTSWELMEEGIDHAIIADNAAGHFMARGGIDLVITGADRIAMNGDSANKIGTYEKAVLARENGIPFYVAAPSSTFDPSAPTGGDIPIEERGEEEVLWCGGSRMAPEGARARNPAFDVTPARYIRAFITERGVLKPSEVRRTFGRDIRVT